MINREIAAEIENHYSIICEWIKHNERHTRQGQPDQADKPTIQIGLVEFINQLPGQGR